jgi:hypothetical protein
MESGGDGQRTERNDEFIGVEDGDCFAVYLRAGMEDGYRRVVVCAGR